MANAIESFMEWMRRKVNDDGSPVHSFKHVAQESVSEFASESLESIIGRANVQRMIGSPGITGWFFTILMLVPKWMVLWVFTALTTMVRHQHFIPFTRIPIPRQLSSAIATGLGAVGPGLLDAIGRFQEEEKERQVFQKGMAAAHQQANPSGVPMPSATRATPPPPEAHPAPAAAHAASTVPPTPVHAAATAAAAGAAGATAAAGASGPPKPPDKPAEPKPVDMFDPSKMTPDQWASLGLFRRLLEVRATDMIDRPLDSGFLQALMRGPLNKHGSIVGTLPVFSADQIAAAENSFLVLEAAANRPVSERQTDAIQAAREATYAVLNRYSTFIAALEAAASGELHVGHRILVGVLDFANDKVTEQHRARLGAAATTVWEFIAGTVEEVEVEVDEHGNVIVPKVKLNEAGKKVIRRPSFVRQIWTSILSFFVLLGLIIGFVILAVVGAFGLSGLLGALMMFIGLTAGLTLLAVEFFPHMAFVPFGLNAAGVLVFLGAVCVRGWEFLFPGKVEHQNVERVDEHGTVFYKAEKVKESPLKSGALKISVGTLSVMLLMNLGLYLGTGQLTMNSGSANHGLLVILGWTIALLAELGSFFARYITDNQRFKAVSWLMVRLLMVAIGLTAVVVMITVGLKPDDQQKVLGTTQELGSGAFNVVVDSAKEGTARADAMVDEFTIARKVYEACLKERATMSTSYCDVHKNLWPCKCD